MERGRYEDNVHTGRRIVRCHQADVHKLSANWKDKIYNIFFSTLLNIFAIRINRFSLMISGAVNVVTFNENNCGN